MCASIIILRSCDTLTFADLTGMFEVVGIVILVAQAFLEKMRNGAKPMSEVTAKIHDPQKIVAMICSRHRGLE